MEWLNKLTAGDTVIVTGPWLRKGTVARVERLTRTQVILEGKQGRFSRAQGSQVGTGNLRLSEATEHRLHNALHADLVIKLQSINWHNESLDSLRRTWEAFSK